MSSTTPRTDSEMRRADLMMPNAVVVSAPMARSLESDLKEALREIARLQTVFPLLREVMVLHRSADSPEYNECDKSPCMWCEIAAKIMTPNLNSPTPLDA